MKKDPFALYTESSRVLRIKKKRLAEVETLATGRIGLRAPAERFSWRIVYSIAIACFALLCARVVFLQVIQGQEFYSRSEGNRIEVTRIMPLRGEIVDHRGVPLVKNVPNFQLLLDGSRIDSTDSTEQQQLYSTLDPYLTISQEDFDKRFESAESNQIETIVEEDIPYEQALHLMSLARTENLFRVNVSYHRQYLYGEVLGHVLGYEGKMTQEEYATLKSKGYALNDEVGKSGIEKVYEEYLRGVPGEERIEVDNQGRKRNVISTTEAVLGSQLQLSIDIGLQQKLYDAIQAHVQKNNLPGGSAVALDPRTGAVRALVSYPGYNNNDFVSGISTEQYAAYIQDEHKPLFHRAISGEYPSGSTFKPIVAAAALNEGIITPSTSVVSVGGFIVAGARFPDWKEVGGHGSTNVYKAIAESVNTFFYMIGGGLPESDKESLGVYGIVEYARRFGLGEVSNIDLPGEAKGFLPTPEWKEEFKNEPWFLGDTYHIAIGQGDVLVTPLQVANYTAAFANGGTLFAPYVVESITEQATKEKANTSARTLREDMVSDSALTVVRDAMRQTVLVGTARSLATLPVTAAGKTGTAQFGDNTHSHSWFTSFAPFEAPELVVTVLVESGGEGNEAALPIAQEALNYYFSR